MAKGPKIPVNNISFVIDRSGSMWSIKKDVVKVFNEQLKAIKEQAKRGDQETFVSLYTFNSKVDKPLYLRRQAQVVKPLKSINATGGTALLDAVGTAMTAMSKSKGAKDAHVSFLLLVITDGEEGSSRKFRTSLPGMIKTAQKSGRWSIAFLTPKSGIRTLKKFGIPKGNIQDWDASAKGAKAAGEKLKQGLNGFFEGRRSGQAATSGFFTADLSKVSVGQVADKLKNASKAFEVWDVDQDGAVIRAFVDKKLKGKGTYQAGNGYYELTKSELVQAQKEIAI
ncbi:MAG TPA: vWA domain-containing protein, partial [Kofleriaceae bacterium]|nr:vWA domain-containing protein [Kofleriaceae bacterium]